MAISPGTRLTHYEILGLLGAGGMGEVFRARDLRLNREVAIKVMKAGLPEDAVSRFGQEARAAGGLNHPGIVAVFDVGEYEGQPYVVTELLEGENLRHKLADGPLSPRKAASLGSQVARALAAAHARGVIHRDIKPENLFVTTDGHVKILDFGLAKLREPQPEASNETQSLTAPGVLLGTVPYMPPEHARGGEVDERGDLFSFGVTLYEMVGGRRPFTGATMADVLSSILREDPAPLPAKVPPAFQALIRRCLEKDRDERFGSARDLAFALEAAGGSNDSGEDPATDVSAASALARADKSETGETGDRTPSRAARGRRLFAGLAGAALLVAATGLVTQRMTARPDPTFTRVSFGHEVVTRARFGATEGTVVFSARVEGRPPRIFVRRPDQPNPVPLDLENVDLLSVSSKGDLAILLSPLITSPFLATGRLARVPLSGGAPRELMDNVSLAEWTPDGEGLAVVTDHNGVARLEFPTGTTLFETAGLIQAFRFSPQGHRIAFLHEPVRGRGGPQVMVMESKGGEPRALGPGPGGGMPSLSWDASGQRVLVGGQTVRAYRDTGEADTVLPFPGLVGVQDVDAQGRFLVDAGEIRADIITGTSGAPPRSISYLSRSIATGLSLDGRLLAFLEFGPGEPFACVRDLRDDRVVNLGPGVPNSFTPDGRFLLTLSSEGGPATLVPTGVGKPLTLPDIRSDAVDFGSISPDGETAAFVETTSDGTLRVFVRGLHEDATQVTLFRGRAPWTGVIFDNTSSGVVTAVSLEGLVRLPIDGGPPQPIPGTIAGDIPLMVTADAALYLQRLEDLPGLIYAVNMKTGARRVAFETTAADPGGVFAYGPTVISADGRTWAASVHRQLSQLLIVER